MRHKITIIFTVDAEPIGGWTSQAVALDHIRHVIDEGYTLDGTWEPVSIDDEEVKAPAAVQAADPESYPQSAREEASYLSTPRSASEVAL